MKGSAATSTGRTKHERTLPELTAAYPEFLRVENLPDNCTAIQIAVFSQRSLRYVRAAIHANALDARQSVGAGNWRIKRDAAVRWVAGETPHQVRHLRRRGG